MKAMLRKALGFLRGILIGGIAGIGTVILLKEGIIDFSDHGFFAIAGYILLAYYFQVVVHEFGHFLFGKLAGFTFYSFRVGYLAIQRENRKLKLKLFRNLGYLGLCIMLPVQQKVSRKATILYFAGGLILNLLAFLVCLALLIHGQFNGPFVFANAAIAFYFFIFNAIPKITKSNMRNDGMHIYNALKQNEAYQTNLQLFAINALLMSGTRPADLPEKYLRMHGQVTDPAAKISFLYYDYYRFLDSKAYPEAFQCIQEIEKDLEHYPKAGLKELQAEILFAYCFLQPDPEKARQLHTEVKDRLAKDYTASGYRIKTAFELYITGNMEKGKAYLEKGRQVLNAYLVPGFIPMEAALAKEMEQVSALAAKAGIQPEPAASAVLL